MYKSYKAWCPKHGGIIWLTLICALFTLATPWGSIGFSRSLGEAKQESSGSI